MYEVKRRWLIILISVIIAVTGLYIVNTNRSVKSGYNVDLIGNIYISTDESFSYEFIDENNLYKYTVDSYYKISYLYSDGVFIINEYEEELEAIALNFGKEFYILTNKTYMILAN